MHASPFPMLSHGSKDILEHSLLASAKLSSHRRHIHAIHTARAVQYVVEHDGVPCRCRCKAYDAQLTPAVVLHEQLSMNQSARCSLTATENNSKLEWCVVVYVLTCVRLGFDGCR